MFKLEIETDNAAFGDDPLREIAHILRQLSLRLEDRANGSPMPISVWDSNGNKVGNWSLELDGDK